MSDRTNDVRQSILTDVEMAKVGNSEELWFESIVRLTKTLLWLSGGAIALSLNFVQNLSSPLVQQYLLGVSWGCILFSILFQLMFLLAFSSKLANDIRAQDAASVESVEEENLYQVKKEILVNSLNILMRIEVVFFILGVAVFSWFAFVNIGLRASGAAQ